MANVVNFGDFLKLKAYRQIVLPDRSILIGQKLMKNAKMANFRFFGNLKVTLKQCYQTGQIDGKCQNSKIQMRHFEQFSNTVFRWNVGH